MATPNSNLPIILYHYSYSPYARRVVWYLRLRGIPYIQCNQPPILPRPDITRLGIKYRRVPILSIGRDIYLDSRLIIAKLEEQHPSLTRLGATPGTSSLALERLLSILHIDAGVFFRAAQLLPTNLPLLRDPKFRADRADFFRGTPAEQQQSAIGKAEAAAQRAEAVGEVRRAFALLETTALADGRTWILGTEGPTLADIEAVWPLHWVVGLPGMVPAEAVSRERFPLVFGWIDRFEAALKKAGEKAGKPRTVSGEEAERIILGSRYSEGEMGVDEGDMLVKELGLKKRQSVELWPTDSGSAHKDRGKLVGYDGDEFAIETVTGSGSETVRVHAPVHGFRLRPTDGTQDSSKL